MQNKSVIINMKVSRPNIKRVSPVCDHKAIKILANIIAWMNGFNALLMTSLFVGLFETVLGDFIKVSKCHANLILSALWGICLHSPSVKVTSYG